MVPVPVTEVREISPGLYVYSVQIDAPRIIPLIDIDSNDHFGEYLPAVEYAERPRKKWWFWRA